MSDNADNQGSIRGAPSPVHVSIPTAEESALAGGFPRLLRIQYNSGSPLWLPVLSVGQFAPGEGEPHREALQPRQQYHHVYHRAEYRVSGRRPPLSNCHILTILCAAKPLQNNYFCLVISKSYFKTCLHCYFNPLK